MLTFIHKVSTTSRGASKFIDCTERPRFPSEARQALSPKCSSMIMVDEHLKK